MSIELAISHATGIWPDFPPELISALQNVHRFAGVAGIHNTCRLKPLMSKPTTLMLHLAHIPEVLQAFVKPGNLEQNTSFQRVHHLNAYSAAMPAALHSWHAYWAEALSAAAASAVAAQHAHEHRLSTRHTPPTWRTAVALAATAAASHQAHFRAGDARWWPAALCAAAAALSLAAAAVNEYHHRCRRARHMEAAKLALEKEMGKLGQLLEELLESAVLGPLRALEAALMSGRYHDAFELDGAVQKGVGTFKEAMMLLGTGEYEPNIPEGWFTG